jgi:hypothetical protein
MRSLGFVGTLLFAAVASVVLVVAHVVAAPSLGARSVLALFTLAAAVGYAALLGPSLRSRVRNGGAALLGGVVVLVLARGFAEIALGMALVLALVRGFLARRSPPLRALVVEIALGVGGLCLARWLAVPGVLGAAAGFWGYALVQSLYFLVPGGHLEAVETTGDPFERARERLSALLDDS